MRHDADYCSFSVPDGWIPRPPAGYVDCEGDAAILVEVEEQWIHDGASGSGYAAERKSFLERCYEDFTVLEEGPTATASPNAHGLAVRYEDDDLQVTLQREVYLAQGPLLCILRLISPADATGRHERVFDGIAKTFAITGGQALAKAENFSLFVAPEKSLREDIQNQRIEFRFCCVSLLVPQHWVAETDGAEAVLRSSQAEIRVRRLLGAIRKPDIWMGGQLRKLREDRGAQLLGWSQGTFEGQGNYIALLVDETAGTRRWQTASTHRTLRLMLARREPLEWTVRAALQTPAEIEPILGYLIANTVSIEPERWRTRPLQRWIDFALDGPWTSETLGVYAHPDDRLPVLELRSQELGRSLDELQPYLLEAMRNGAGVLPGSKTEKETLGYYRGLDAYRYAGDGQLSVRGIWLVAKQFLYTCLLQARVPQAADELFLRIVESLQIPGMREKK